MKIPYRISILAVATLFAACSGGGKETAPGFSEPVALTADSIAISQIIDPFQWTSVGGHCVILGKSTEKTLHVYSFPDFEYRYSALTRGQGPGELGPYAFIIPGDVSSGRLFLHERLTSNALSEFSVSDTELSLCGEPAIQKGSLICVTQDTLVVKEKKRYKEEKCYTTLESTEHPGMELDSMVNYNIYKIKESANSISIFKMNAPFYLCKDDTLVMAYKDTRRLDFSDISKGKFKTFKTLGDNSTLKELESRITDMGNGMWSFGGQGEFFAAADASADYIYVLLCRYSPEHPDDMSKKSSSVLVYDWKGNELRRFDLDKYVNMMVADRKTGNLFCYDSALDFERVYVYRPNI